MFLTKNFTISSVLEPNTPLVVKKYSFILFEVDSTISLIASKYNVGSPFPKKDKYFIVVYFSSMILTPDIILSLSNLPFLSVAAKQ